MAPHILLKDPFLHSLSNTFNGVYLYARLFPIATYNTCIYMCVIFNYCFKELHQFKEKD